MTEEQYEELSKTILGLQLPSDPRWVDIAEMNIEEILVDHAYCEQKAASSCISLIIQFSDKDRVVEVLTPVVAEEWEHFERVIKELRKRGHSLGKARKDEYVLAIQQIVKKGGSRDEQLVEKLLLNALIEARSCERFKLLWKHIKDKELSQFYYELMVSEAGHYVNFISLAKEFKPEAYVKARWQEFLAAEADIMKSITPRNDRIH